MEEKNNFSRNVVIGGFAMLIAILVFCWYGGYRTNRNDDNIENTIQSISSDNKRAGEDIDNARQEIGSAGENVSRAIQRVDRVEIITRQNTDTIKECRELTRQCSEYNSRAKQILADIERANKKTKVSSTP